MTPPNEVVGLAAKLSERRAVLDFLATVEDFCRLSGGPFRLKYPDIGPHEGADYLARKARALRAHLTGGIHE